MRAERSHQPDIFLTLLTVLFIGLKLTGFIDWSWWWVLAPIWIPTVVVLLGFVGFVLFAKQGGR